MPQKVFVLAGTNNVAAGCGVTKAKDEAIDLLNRVKEKFRHAEVKYQNIKTFLWVKGILWTSL